MWYFGRQVELIHLNKCNQKREETQVTDIWNTRGGPNTDSVDIIRIMWVLQTSLCQLILQHKIDDFLDIHKLPKLT